MKNIILAFTLTALVFPSFAQQKKVLTPARGHYQQLTSFSAKAKSPSEAVDQLSFPYDKAVAERRLSLKTVYLTNINLDQFTIPTPPANSSEQTRKELNYLLGLQAQRTDLDVHTSKIMAIFITTHAHASGFQLSSLPQKSLLHRALGWHMVSSG
jgi:hypothetical protein